VSKTIGWFEEYRTCGCISETVKRKRDLLGYCAKHGSRRAATYHEMQDGAKQTSRDLNPARPTPKGTE
jgi:hypothetical protein